MSRFSSKLFLDDPSEPLRINDFWEDDLPLFTDDQQALNSTLKIITFKVSRKPNNLLAHLRRIYFCYQHHLSEPLYAALLDFLIVLNGKGHAICQRLIEGSRAELDSAQLAAIKNAIRFPLQATGNRYSVFTKGMLGTARLVEVRRHGQKQHDYLALANDFIEFSQLEEAMTTLESGLSVDPSREDLQLALLELYKSTKSRDRFHRQYQSLRQIGATLVEGWRLLADYFDGNTV